MEIKHFKNDIASYMTFENIYDDRELELIWQEAQFLCYHHKLDDPKKTGAAVDINLKSMKSNRGLWIDETYSNRNTSNYLRIHKKFIDYIVPKQHDLQKIDFNMKLFFSTNNDHTLLSYYENEDYYDAHIDKSCYTYVFWLFKEPKKFIGGDLLFPELNQTINIKSNMAVLFPSWLDHQVDKIKMYDTIEKYKSNGRFAFTTFYNVI